MSFFIQADVFGKKKYWELINGLHSGKGKSKGYSIYKTKKEAEDVVKCLKKVFHSEIKFEVKPETEIPFIKAQTIKKTKK